MGTPCRRVGVVGSKRLKVGLLAMIRPIAEIYVAVALAAGSNATAANAATIFSDDFESPVVVGNGNTGHGDDNYGTGSTIGPWTVVGPSGAADAVSVVTKNFTQNGISFPSQSGNQWADLAGQEANGTEGVKVIVSGLLGKNTRSLSGSVTSSIQADRLEHRPP